MQSLSEEYLRDHYDTMLKGIGLLLAAHGAAFVACLVALKDYDTLPRLKGIGLIVTLEGTGLIACALFYLTAHFARSGALFDVQVRSESTEGWVFMGIFISTGLAAFGTFIASVAIVIYRFHSL